MGFYAYFNFIILVNLLDRSREDSKDEHMHLSDAVLESVMVFRLAAGAVAEVVVSLGLAKAGFLSGIHFTILYNNDKIYIFFIPNP